jgi:hypothetical protein
MSDNSNGVMYAVFRNGQRVSDTEYPFPFYAQQELELWQNIINRHPDGSKLEIRPINPPTANPNSL